MTNATLHTDSKVMLLTRKACHLCDSARDIVTKICAEMGQSWEETDVDRDPELCAEYGDQVPVVLVDGREVAALRVDGDVLRGALSRGV